MAYDAKTDYQALISAEAAKGSSANTAILAALENARNEKIAGMNAGGTNTGGYTATNIYTGNTGGGSSVADYQPKGNYNDAILSPGDRKRGEAYKQQYAESQARGDTKGMADAHAGMEAIRAKYGYSGGVDGSEYWELPGSLPTEIQYNSALRPNLMGLEMGDKYGITYDRQQILDILNKAAQAQYDFKNQEYQQTENRFYGNILTTQGTALDTMRRAQAAAVATGATRGMAAANELSAVLGLQQEGVGAATELAQERNNLASEHAANMAENENTALTTSNTLKQAIAQLALSKYGYDTQGYIGDLDYMAALKDIEASMYQADKTLEGVKYNADANVAAAGKASGSGTTGGTGRATWGSIKNYWESDPGIKADSSAMEDLNENIKNGDGSWSPDEQSYTIHGLDPNTNKYRIETSEGTLSLTPEQMTKLKNSDWDLTSATDANYGSWGYDKSYDTGSTKSWTEAQAIDYFKKNGKNPPGWQVNDLGSSQNPTTGSGVNRIYRAYYVGDKQDNTFAITNQQGQKISVGYGTGASTWTYNTTTGMWSNTTGTSLNQKNFQAYLEKQNPMYVKKLN